MKLEKKYLIYSIILMSLTLISSSVSYMISNVSGSKRTISVSVADLSIVFTGGSSISASDIEEGWSTAKTFSVENKSKEDYNYNIIIENLINTFTISGDIYYKITSSDGGYNMSNYEKLRTYDTANNEVLAYDIDIEAGSKHNYSIEFKYDKNSNKFINLNSKLTGNIYIGEGTENPTPQFIQKILAYNPTVSTRTDFSVINISNTTGIIYKTNKTEDGSIVYYYSGNTTNNWVYFGGFYWRIIRTNEDGSVRLLYAGTSTSTTSGYISTSAFNNTYSESRYGGFMYGGNSSLADNRNNTTNSTIKGVIDTWYQNYLLTNYDKYISKTAIYCNDRSVGSGTWVNTGSNFYYGAYTRVASNNIPNYKCGSNTSNGLFESSQAIQDKFSVSTGSGGNGQLTYPIALMTADEVAFAGGKFETLLSSPYAYYYTNSEGGSIVGEAGTFWWLLTPSIYLSRSNNFLVHGSDYPGFLNQGYVELSYGRIRPVISIDSCAKVTGTGTPTDPYQIDETNSTC